LKFCVITYDEYINIPYVQKYEKIFKENGIAHDIILWDRTGNGSEVSPYATNNYIFKSKTNASKLSKIVPFIKWRCFTKEILRNNTYDGLIVCTTTPGVILTDILTKHYRGKFILDIRDYTHEHISFFKKIAQKNIRAAGLVTISSEGFKRWLPDDISPVVTHNISNTESAETLVPNFDKSGPLTIGFVGGVRYFEENKKLIDGFANNSKFKLLYIGKHHPGGNLKEYCEAKLIENVEFRPRFDNSQKPSIYKQIDFINSVYGAESEETRSLLPNRLYDCILFKKPIIVSMGTYLESVVDEYNLGIAIDTKRGNLPGQLGEYVAEFDSSCFLEGCEDYLGKVRRDEITFEGEVVCFLSRIAKENRYEK